MNTSIILKIKKIVKPFCIENSMNPNIDEEHFRYPYGNKIYKTYDELKPLFKDVKLNLRAKYTLEFVTNNGVWLDLGPGPGGITSKVADKVEYVTAIDIDEDHLKVAKIFSNKDNIDFVHSDIFKLKLPDHCYDGIIFTEVIEHVESPEKYLKEIHRILKPEGELIISTPNANYYLELLKSLFFFSEKRLKKHLVNKQRSNSYHVSTNSGHIYAWTYSTLLKLLNKNGFLLQDIRYCTFSLPSLNIKGRIIGGKENNLLKYFLGPFSGTILMKCIKKI